MADREWNIEEIPMIKNGKEISGECLVTIVNESDEEQILDEKFGVIANALNQAAFNGRGDITRLNKRAFNLYENGQNQIILFRYSTGHLTIMWKYKYFQKEVIHERQFDNVRNLSIFEQQKIAEHMIFEMALIIKNHKGNVIGGAL